MADPNDPQDSQDPQGAQDPQAQAPTQNISPLAASARGNFLRDMGRSLGGSLMQAGIQTAVGGLAKGGVIAPQAVGAVQQAFGGIEDDLRMMWWKRDAQDFAATQGQQYIRGTQLINEDLNRKMALIDQGIIPSSDPNGRPTKTNDPFALAHANAAVQREAFMKVRDLDMAYMSAALEYQDNPIVAQSVRNLIALRNSNMRELLAINHQNLDDADRMAHGQAEIERGNFYRAKAAHLNDQIPGSIFNGMFGGGGGSDQGGASGGSAGGAGDEDDDEEGGAPPPVGGGPAHGIADQHGGINWDSIAHFAEMNKQGAALIKSRLGTAGDGGAMKGPRWVQAEHDLNQMANDDPESYLQLAKQFGFKPDPKKSAAENAQAAKLNIGDTLNQAKAPEMARRYIIGDLIQQDPAFSRFDKDALRHELALHGYARLEEDHIYTDARDKANNTAAQEKEQTQKESAKRQDVVNELLKRRSVLSARLSASPGTSDTDFSMSKEAQENRRNDEEELETINDQLKRLGYRDQARTLGPLLKGTARGLLDNVKEFWNEHR